MLEVLLLFLRTAVLAARSRRDLALENLVLRHQLQVALRTNPHPRLQAPDRVLWVWLRRLWPEGWREHLRIVKPETSCAGTGRAGDSIGGGGREPGSVDPASVPNRRRSSAESRMRIGCGGPNAS